MELYSVFVTGANRGIGLEFVRQLVQLQNPPKYIFASYRNPDTIKTLQELKDANKATQIILIKMDVRNPEEITAARKLVETTVGDKGLTLLINNAGVAKHGGLFETSLDDYLFHFNTNTLGPIAVFKELHPLLKQSADQKECCLCTSRAAVLNISSMAGCIANVPIEPPTWLKIIGYRTSKAALNMSMRVAACEVKNHGILVVNMCPGWVKTDMGTDQGHLEPAESISSMLKTLETLNESHLGAFLDRNGQTIPF